MKSLSNLRRATVFSSAARMLALLAQFVVLIVMSRILPKDDFGLAMIAFSLFRVASYSLGTGIGNIVLYYVGRSGGDPIVNLRVHRSATIIAGIISLLLAALAVIFSQKISSLFGQPRLAEWIVHMAPFMLFGTLSFTAMGSLEGRSRVTDAIVMAELAPGLIRIVLMLLVATFKLPMLMIAHIMWIAVALPWMWEMLRLREKEVVGKQRWTVWDIKYASQYALISLLSLQLQGIDIVIVGALFSPDVAAEYAIAARLATLFFFFQSIVLKNFAPRAGVLIRSEQKDSLNVELRQVRWTSLLAIGVITGGILMASPIIVSFFGNYEAAIPILAALSLMAFAKGVISGSDVILKMSGYSGYSLAIASSYMFLLLILSFALSPLIGIFAIPVGMLVGAVVVNPVISYFMRSKMGLDVSGKREFAYASTCCCAIGGVTISSSNVIFIAGAGALVLIVTAVAWRITFPTVQFKRA